MDVGRTEIEEEASESLLMREAALGVLMSPLSVCSFTSVFVVISFTIPPASGPSTNSLLAIPFANSLLAIPSTNSLLAIPFANSLLAIPSTNSLLAIPSTNSLSSTCPFHPSTLSCVMMDWLQFTLATLTFEWSTVTSLRMVAFCTTTAPSAMRSFINSTVDEVEFPMTWRFRFLGGRCSWMRYD